MNSTTENQRVAIIGAGPVGSLLALYLARRGCSVSVFERRPDLRKNQTSAGRSINLALSNRGIRALEEVGLAEQAKGVAIPMLGRMMHDVKGNLTLLPYGKQGQFIHSISRHGLNSVLIDAAEKAGAIFRFDSRCLKVDVVRTELFFQSPLPQAFDVIAGADGAFSAVRSAMQTEDRFNFSQQYIDHGYREFHIPAGKAGDFQFEKNALHIWPRESFMMIALPNPDASFTATLFLPWEGATSFRSLDTKDNIVSFFEKNFPDAAQRMPRYLADFDGKAASSLVSVKCWPWVHNRTFLIGDAAHAIVPFYGQGMNAGFEDCRILNGLLDTAGDWGSALSQYQQLRKPDADAIATLALDNFVEMRDLVANDTFLLRKKIEAKLHSLYPDAWIPLYSMVTFHDGLRYSEAYATGQDQKTIMDRVMATPHIESVWETLDFREIVRQLATH